MGVVKFFNSDRGFGFIRRDDGQGDIFVHISDLKKSSIDAVSEGDRLAFNAEQSQNGKGLKAVGIKRV
jgi:CspA family cold shock protein